jgi:hypothetical protein
VKSKLQILEVIISSAIIQNFQVLEVVVLEALKAITPRIK